MNSAIRVLCVDDRTLMREGLSLILGLEVDFEVVAMAANGQQAVEYYKRYRPDIVLMDLYMPVSTGLEATKAILDFEPRARIIVLTMFEGDADVRKALEAGAISYVLKDSAPRDLVRVIRDAWKGERTILPNVEARLRQHDNDPILTRREIDILSAVGKGLRNKEIASDIGISEETVHVHLRNIFAKLNVTDRTAAVRIGIERGFIHL